MIIGLLGDIHGNADALDVVLKKARNLSVDELLVTGDLVGYYFEPFQVMEMLKPWRKKFVRGNHEEMLGKAEKDPEYMLWVEKHYGSGLRIALEELPSDTVKELSELPLTLSLSIGERNILLCHGVPGDCNTYLYPDSGLKLLGSTNLDAIDLVIMGHTHYSMLRWAGARTRLINPGSVGQPRNGRPGAHWATYDTESGVIDFHTEPYDYSAIQLKARMRHPNLRYLADVFDRR
jgi:putative phosphoesterase